jgi:hypothetical protein
MFVKQWRMATLNGRTDITLISTVVAAVAIGAVFWAAPAWAQARSTPTIDVAPEIMVIPGVLTPLSVAIGRAEAAPQQAMLVIRGLPARVTLSEGRSFSPGVWAVPVASVGKLEMAPAHGTSGRADLTMELITLDGTVIANAASTLYILPAARDIAPPADANGKGSNIALTAGPLAIKPGGPAASSQTPASLGGAAGRLTAKELENAVSLMGKGDDNMRTGKIGTARLFYKSAAESGYAPAALAMGGTYDSRQLAQWKVVGLQADPAQARSWYEKARDLGSPEANRRLQELGAR